MSAFFHCAMNLSNKNSLTGEICRRGGLVGVDCLAMPGVRERIRNAIEDAKTLQGIRKKDLAAALGVKPQQFSNLLSGTNEWSLSHLDRLAEALGISIATLVGQDGDNEDAELHRKLQAILDADGEFRIGIRININAIYNDVLKWRHGELGAASSKK